MGCRLQPGSKDLAFRVSWLTLPGLSGVSSYIGARCKTLYLDCNFISRRIEPFPSRQNQFHEAKIWFIAVSITRVVRDRPTPETPETLHLAPLVLPVVRFRYRASGC